MPRQSNMLCTCTFMTVFLTYASIVWPEPFAPTLFQQCQSFWMVTLIFNWEIALSTRLNALWPTSSMAFHTICATCTSLSKQNFEYEHVEFISCLVVVLHIRLFQCELNFFLWLLSMLTVSIIDCMTYAFKINATTSIFVCLRAFGKFHIHRVLCYCNKKRIQHMATRMSSFVAPVLPAPPKGWRLGLLFTDN